jgi:hypothetical protein
VVTTALAVATTRIVWLLVSAKNRRAPVASKESERGAERRALVPVPSTAPISPLLLPTHTTDARVATLMRRMRLPPNSETAT